MNPSPHREQPHLALARCMPHEREVGRGATELPRGKAASGPYRSASGEPPSTLSSSRCDEGSHSLEKSPRCDEGSHLVVYGCGGPQPLAGEQIRRVQVRDPHLNPYFSRDHVFKAFEERLPRPARHHGRRVALVAEPPHSRPRPRPSRRSRRRSCATREEAANVRCAVGCAVGS